MSSGFDPNNTTQSNVVPVWALSGVHAQAGASMSGGTGAVEYEEEQFLAFYKQSKFKKRCVRCGTFYDDMGALGRHECLYHPGEFNYDQPGRNYGRYQYECCGMTDDPHSLLRNFQHGFPKGCTRADHTRLENPYTDLDDIVVPMSYADRFEFFEETSTVVAAGTKIRVHRRDVDTEKRRLMVGQAPPDSAGPDKERDLTPVVYRASNQ